MGKRGRERKKEREREIVCEREKGIRIIFRSGCEKNVHYIFLYNVVYIIVLCAYTLNVHTYLL